MCQLWCYRRCCSIWRLLASCIGDEIFADKSSIVGSIGVISASFGFTEAINKLERRGMVNQGSLDPFNPKRRRRTNAKNIMNDTQKAFVDLVSKEEEISYQMITPFLQVLLVG